MHGAQREQMPLYFARGTQDVNDYPILNFERSAIEWHVGINK